MADFIPFVASQEDWDLAVKIHSDSRVFRVPLHRLESGIKRSDDVRLWVDAGVDGYERLLRETDPWWDHEERDRAEAREVGTHQKRGPAASKTHEEKLCATQEGRQRDPWRRCLKRVPEHRALTEARTVEGRGPTQNRGRIETFVFGVLAACAEHQPAWISVPQLPYEKGTGRNKINRVLADATAKWRTGSPGQWELILPVVLTHRDQYRRKAERRDKTKTIADCYRRSGADGIWVVDSGLGDQRGTGPLTDRFGELVQFHEELNEALPDEPLRVAGPYWGMNLILWARGLVDCPAAGVGRGYQYHIPGGRTSRASHRIALPPLRRWVPTGGSKGGRGSLKDWLGRALEILSRSEEGHRDLRRISDDYKKLVLKGAAQRQTAEFYKVWLDAIAETEERSLALFQDLSAAYVLGKRLPDLPTVNNPGREPGEIARQFMLNCL